MRAFRCLVEDIFEIDEAFRSILDVEDTEDSSHWFTVLQSIMALCEERTGSLMETGHRNDRISLLMGRLEHART